MRWICASLSYCRRCRSRVVGPSADRSPIGGGSTRRVRRGRRSPAPRNARKPWRVKSDRAKGCRSGPMMSRSSTAARQRRCSVRTQKVERAPRGARNAGHHRLRRFTRCGTGDCACRQPPLAVGVEVSSVWPTWSIDAAATSRTIRNCTWLQPRVSIDPESKCPAHSPGEITGHCGVTSISARTESWAFLARALPPYWRLPWLAPRRRPRTARQDVYERGPAPDATDGTFRGDATCGAIVNTWCRSSALSRRRNGQSAGGI